VSLTTQSSIANALGRNALALTADLADAGVLDGLVAQAEQWRGQLDIFVNNAGIIRRADTVDLSELDWDTVIDTNLKSLFFLSQAATKRMLPRGSGKIINIASLLSFEGGIRVASYTGSKSGVAGLTRLMACEWAGRGINVNAVAPGYFETNNTEALRSDAARSTAILSRIPAGHWGQSQEIGGAAVFLASEASAYVHGVVLPVDGGWLAR
jgi:2-dehydro-3-deoxy-D-gluconate 5-dehydrogenase